MPHDVEFLMVYTSSSATAFVRPSVCRGNATQLACVKTRKTWNALTPLACVASLTPLPNHFPGLRRAAARHPCLSQKEWLCFILPVATAPQRPCHRWTAAPYTTLHYHTVTRPTYPQCWAPTDWFQGRQALQVREGRPPCFTVTSTRFRDSPYAHDLQV